MPPAEPVHHLGGLLTRIPGEPWWEAVIAGNTLAAWGLALILLLGSVAVLHLLVRFLAARVAKLASRTTTNIDDLFIGLLAGTRGFFMWAVGMALASLPLALAPEVLRIGQFIVVVAIGVQAVLWGGKVVSFGVDWFLRRRARQRGGEDGALATSMVAVRFIALLALYSIVFLVAADNLGFDVTALVAGLGITGIAVALAVQSILGDLFSSLSIVFDKPFVVGDFIVIGEETGTVEYIGLKTTRLRALSGEQLIVSNSDLLGSRIHNFKRMRERRAVFTVGLAYANPPELLERIPGLIRGAVEDQPKVRIEYSAFKQFGITSLDFETVYWIQSPDYTLYMETQQKINLGIMGRLTEAGARFASPNAPVPGAPPGAQPAPIAPAIPQDVSPSTRTQPERGSGAEPAGRQAAPDSAMRSTSSPFQSLQPH
jgi:small-conductance mechanosensitive channel